MYSVNGTLGRAPEKSNAELLTKIADLSIALTRRDQIGQAKGMIRLLFSCDDQSSFTVLARMSQDSNRKVYDVAGLLVECLSDGRALPPALATSLKRATSHLDRAQSI